MAWAVVRVRGNVGVKREIRETLSRLLLTRVNHAVVIPETETYRGMLQKAKDYITWGEVDEDTLESLILKRGEMKKNGKATREKLEEAVGKKWKEILEGVIKNEIKLHRYLDPFRLHPPRKGYRSVKLPFKVGGSLGYRGKAINDLLRRMM